MFETTNQKCMARWVCSNRVWTWHPERSAMAWRFIENVCQISYKVLPPKNNIFVCNVCIEPHLTSYFTISPKPLDINQLVCLSPTLHLRLSFQIVQLEVHDASISWPFCVPPATAAADAPSLLRRAGFLPAIQFVLPGESWCPRNTLKCNACAPCDMDWADSRVAKPPRAPCHCSSLAVGRSAAKLSRLPWLNLRVYQSMAPVAMLSLTLSYCWVPKAVLLDVAMFKDVVGQP